MDALALLCNLYGDGPATLKRLRSAGCDSFSALEDLEPDQVAEILGTNEAAARRFLREARLLVERVAEGGLEQEEHPPLVSATRPALPRREPATALAANAAPPQAFARPAGETPPPQFPAGASAPTEQPGSRALSEPGSRALSEEERSSVLIDRVLATWRERDATVGAERDVEFSDGDEPVETEELAETGVAPGTPLRARLVDGLDRTQCERLKGGGFETLEALADAEALDVARRTEIELTRILRLQFLARRLISERGQVESPEPPDVLKPAGRPWPLARSSTLPTRSPTAGSTEEEAAEAKFSVSEMPFGNATSQLAADLDRASRRMRRSDADPAGPDEGTGGPFA